jgi:hypothetical protein
MSEDAERAGGLDEQHEPRFDEAFTDQDVIDYFWNCFNRSKEVVDLVLADATKLERMYARDSVSGTDAAYLNQTDRQAIDWPFAKGVVDAILGAEMAQRTEAVFDGTDTGPTDSIFAEWCTRIVRHLNGKSDGYNQQVQAFRDCLISGYGFVKTYIDLSRIPIRPRVEHLENWAVYFDPDACQPNLTDSNFWIEEVEWSGEAVEAKWPEKRAEIRKVARSGSSGIGSPAPTVAGGSWQRGTMSGRRNRLTVRRFEYVRDESRATYYDPERDERVEGSLADYEARKAELDDRAEAILTQHALDIIEQDELLAANPLLPPMPPPEEPQPPRIADAHFFAGKVHYACHVLADVDGQGLVLDGPTPISVNDFTIKACTGYAWKNYATKQVRRFGIMRVIEQAQEYLNRALRLYVEIMARGSKGGGFISEDALPDGITPEDFRKNASKPGYWHLVKGNAFGEGLINHNPVQQTPSGFENIYRMCIEAFGLLTGVTQALQGTMTADRSNVTISNLQEQGLQMLLPIREPRKAFTCDLGRLLASLAIAHLPAEELDKILGEQVVEGLTHEEAPPDPMTGQVPIDPKTRRPQLVPILSEEVGDDGQPLPVTPGMLLKGAEVMEYSVTVDLGIATATQRQASWNAWSQHNMLQTALDAGAPPSIMLPAVFKNAPLPGTESQQLGQDLERHYANEEMKGTEEGILKFFSEVPPDHAAQLLEQIQSMMQPVQPPPEQIAA